MTAVKLLQYRSTGDLFWSLGILIEVREACMADYRDIVALLKGLFTNFEYKTFFPCPNKRNIFCERFILKKQLTLEIIEKIGCLVSPTEYCYIYYIYNTNWLCHFEHLFLNYFGSEFFLSRWTLYKKCFFRWGTKKLLYI